MNERPPIEPRTAAIGVVSAAFVLALLWLGFQSYYKVPPGHVAVASLFGKVRSTQYFEGGDAELVRRRPGDA